MFFWVGDWGVGGMGMGVWIEWEASDRCERVECLD